MSGTNLPVMLGGVDFTAAYTPYTSTTGVPEYPAPPFQVGTKVIAGNAGEWIFVTAGSDMTANDIVVGTISSSFTWYQLVNGTARGVLGRLVGKAGATVSSGQMLWVQVGGYASSINVATGSAANTVLSSTSTAGRIGAASAGNSAKVTGLVITATAASNQAAAILNNPAIGTDD